ncbi:MAG: TolC family protein, partial [Candidatus Tumulicola sp.]
EPERRREPITMTIRSTFGRVLATAIALSVLVPGAGSAQGAPPGQIIMPTPAPMPTAGGTPLPYPAYGTPAPDVSHLTARPGVPSVVALSQAVKIAVALSPVFAAQNAQWAAIHARYTSEKQALFPAVSGAGSIGNQYNNQSFNPNAGVSPTSSPGGSIFASRGTTASESLSITIQQLIYDGGRTIAAIHSAKSADYAGRATLLRNLQTLELNVANTYYAVLQNNATVISDAQLVKEFEVSEAAVSAQIRNGAAARSDLAAAQFQTATARGSLVTAQGQAIASQAVFATTLGLDADALAVPKQLGAPFQAPNPSYGVSVKRALLLRPDYIAAAYTVEADKESLRYAKLARFPVLVAGASDGVGRSFGPLSSGYSNGKTLGLNLSVPIYDQGLTNYNVAVAAATLDAAYDSLKQNGLQVESDVRSALANLISARALLVQTQAELTAAKVSLDATQAQYRVGATTIINVVTAEANLSTAQTDQIKALYGTQTAQQNYLYATGTSDLQL